MENETKADLSDEEKKFLFTSMFKKIVIQFGSPVGQPELEERLGKFSGGKQACLLSEEMLSSI